MRPPPRAIRRALLPLDAGALVALAVVCAVGAAAGAVASPLGRRRRVLRIALVGLSYCAIELVGLAGCGALWVRRFLPGRAGLPPDRWVQSNDALLARSLGRLVGAGRRFLGFSIDVVPSSDATPLGGTGPVLVLARHGGPGDSFALVHLLLSRYRRGTRIVLKEILQLDPLLDVLLNRIGCCFVPSGQGAGPAVARQLATMAARLDGHDALLLFPEGANWTPDRLRRAIHRLRRESKHGAAQAAAAMPHVLPPRPGGVLACVDARPDLPVVVVAHAGLDRVVSVAQAWAALPLRTPMTIRAWRSAEPPPGDEARLAWLTGEWAAVDRWVDGVHAGADPVVDHGRDGVPGAGSCP